MVMPGLKKRTAAIFAAVLFALIPIVFIKTEN